MLCSPLWFYFTANVSKLSEVGIQCFSEEGIVSLEPMNEDLLQRANNGKFYFEQDVSDIIIVAPHCSVIYSNIFQHIGSYCTASWSQESVTKKILPGYCLY